MARQNKSQRSGNVLVLCALMMVLLLGMVAFAVDIGYIVQARTELQSTADATALAAAQHLPDPATMTAAAQLAAQQNQAIVQAELDVTDVQPGYWDREAATFALVPPPGMELNAVRVALRASEATGNPLQLWFGGMLGKDTADAMATAIAMADRDLCGPLIGIEWVSVPGSPDTDSYDSSKGSYTSATAGDRGGLCSDGPINVDGAAHVRGSARAGKGYKVTLTGGATVTGSIGSRLKPLNMPPVDASEAALVNDNSTLPGIPKGNSLVSPIDANGNFRLDGSKMYDMPPGTYYFNNFTLEGQSVLNISGPTTIYVVGDLRRAGGTLVNNNTAIPSNLQIMMTGGAAHVTSNNAFHGLLYAPNTAVTIDGASDLYGAVVGRTLTITGSGSVHYDESLGLGEDGFPRRTTLVD